MHIRFDIPPAVRDDGWPVVVTVGGSTGEQRRWLVEFINEQPRYTLAATTLYKHDCRYLKEWIDHSLAVGVEHFYLYDNGEPESLPILQPYVDAGLATVIAWVYPYRTYRHAMKPNWPSNGHLYCQVPQILHAIFKYGPSTRWLLSCDTDEFFYAPKGVKLPPILSRYNPDDVAALSIKGFWFGTNGHATIPEGRIVDAFTKREASPTSGTKCIISPRNVMSTSVHFVESTKPTINVPIDVIRMNHYRAVSTKRRFDNRANEVVDEELSNMKLGPP